MDMSLDTTDIDGAKPCKFRSKGMKYFVDRQEVRYAFGGQPGKYHGYKADFRKGGTFIEDK
jgi:hypothetical protein